MAPKDIFAGETMIKFLFAKKLTLYTFIKTILVLTIVALGTISAFAIIAAATKEPITLIGLGLMGLVIASTYIKN